MFQCFNWTLRGSQREVWGSVKTAHKSHISPVCRSSQFGSCWPQHTCRCCFFRNFPTKVKFLSTKTLTVHQWLWQRIKQLCWYVVCQGDGWGTCVPGLCFMKVKAPWGCSAEHISSVEVPVWMNQDFFIKHLRAPKAAVEPPNTLRALVTRPYHLSMKLKRFSRIHYQKRERGTTLLCSDSFERLIFDTF